MKKRNRVLAVIMAILMVVGMMPMDGITILAAGKTYTFEAASDPVVTALNQKQALPEDVYGDGFFRFTGNNMRAGSSTYAVEISKPGENQGVISFTSYGTTTVEIHANSTGGSNTSEVTLFDAGGKGINAVGKSSSGNEVVGTGSPTVIKYQDLPGGTYTIRVPEGTSYSRGTRILKVVVTETGDGRPARDAWGSVAAPEITNVEAVEDKVVVSFKAAIGEKTGDVAKVTMTDAQGKKTVMQCAQVSESNSVEFEPSSSGKLSFSIALGRYGESDKAGSNTKSIDFVAPLAETTVHKPYNRGNGTMAIEWVGVPEATGYKVSYSADGRRWKSVDAGMNTKAEITGLTVGKEYSFKVVIYRNEEKLECTPVKATVMDKVEMLWAYSAFGDGASTEHLGYKGDANEGSVTVYSKNGKGKLTDASDGISFYYTKIDAALNFTLRAKVKVDNWTYSNGQEGFGLIATDRVGPNGDGSPFWNNSYMAVATKVEYYYDPAKRDITSDTSYSKYSMKLGIGAWEKIGVTLENLSKFENSDVSAYINNMQSLELSSALAVEKEEEKHTNIIGNATNDVAGIDAPNLITEMYLTIQKNNTGYFISYEDMEGNVKTRKFYEPDALEQLDKEFVYVGFFTARNAEVTFSDIRLTTIRPENDAPAEEKVVETLPLSTKVTSATAQGTKEYHFQFFANANGTITITDQDGNVVVDKQQVTANVSWKSETISLSKGENIFAIDFKPEEGFVSEDGKALDSYKEIGMEHSVSYVSFGKPGQPLYVAPGGTGSGTKDKPMNIYDAVRFVQQGQTIVLMEGTYKLDKVIRIERGVDGTADKKMYMIADPDAKSRPVFDFQGLSAGIVLGGDYWVMKGFDVTNTMNGQKGVQVSGNYNTLDDIVAHHNGNTGIQISRMFGTDLWADWPCYNLILNCTSYANADSGYEDADGFAAKLTCGEGNVFDGCIAYNNADDGWDLYAKVASGPIGAVTIKNCVAYKNGYLEDGTIAGNGNGFKLGGDSMKNYKDEQHKLINCVSYDNKTKGIDANSSPQLYIENCISFNNQSYNVALYTKTAKETKYTVKGLLSFKTKFTEVGEQLQPVGTSGNSIYSADNYFWNGDGYSANEAGSKMAADWFVTMDTNIAPTRNADGTINMNGLLVPSDKAAIKTVGLTAGTASLTSADLPKLEEKPDTDTDTDTQKPVDTEEETSKEPDTSVGGDHKDNSNNGNSTWIIILIVILVIIAGCGGAYWYLWKNDKLPEALKFGNKAASEETIKEETPVENSEQSEE